MGHHQDRQVAVKVLRVYSTSDFDKIINVGLYNVRSVSAAFVLITIHIEILQGSHDVENASPPKRVTATGGDDEQ